MNQPSPSRRRAKAGPQRVRTCSSVEVFMAIGLRAGVPALLSMMRVRSDVPLPIRVYSRHSR